MDNEGPRRVVTPLEDAATEEIVFIAGTGTTDAAIGLLPIDTDIGIFAGLTIGLIALMLEFGINSTVVDEFVWFEIEYGPVETCSTKLPTCGVGEGVDIFAFTSFNTQEGGVALIECCTAFTNRLGLSG